MKYNVQVQHWIDYDDGYAAYIDLEVEAETETETLTKAREEYPREYWDSYVVER